MGYMKVPAVHTQKLDDKSKLVIYLGKEPGTKASWLYDTKDDTIRVSLDVMFQEDKF